MEIKIRKGNEKDIKAVFGLIKELADYEKSIHELENSEEEMLADGFGENSIYKFIIAESGNEIIGMALYYIAYSTWKGRCLYLEDLVVSESWRGKGIGQKLFDRIVEITREENTNRLMWQVLDWNEPAINFYKKNGTKFFDNWINCRLTKKQLDEY
ncbi:GNAT family N-acetyltransferase [Flexithrix dorotheae]|uniref:GNAT family N-acetyltransferase n=1 Tax=Flexithrix dorotheae TaxID=70993 RepID=UPI00036EE181|nr:GNAT family N-acetyltransferase [Flexithrix dorotheae]